MSGHSKWATIKHRKGAADKRRGKLFARLIRQVEVAARAGGGDLDANPTLRTMYQKARDASVPLDTIERAIKRGTGELEGVAYVPFTYEGYAQGGVAVLVEVLTDNRNRTSSEIRSLFRTHGGSLAEPGAVAWQFRRSGVISVPRSADEEELMLAAIDAGAADINDDSDAWRVTCEAGELGSVAEALAEAEIAIDGAESTMLATQVVPVDTYDAARSVLRLLGDLDEHDDVQDVYANFDIPDEILEQAAETA